jgi:hypothetical protein
MTITYVVFLGHGETSKVTKIVYNDWRIWLLEKRIQQLRRLKYGMLVPNGTKISGGSAQPRQPADSLEIWRAKLC